MIRRAADLYGALNWRSFALIGAIALVISMLLVVSRPIVMLVDGERVDADVSPITTVNQRAYVPLRSVADALGAETEVDSKTQSIYVVLGTQSLHLRVGDVQATVNGMPITLKHAPFRVRGHVMISLDAIARALHVRARYDPRTARIEVITPGIGEASSAPNTPAE